VLNTLSFWLWAIALISFGLFAATATQRFHADLQRSEAARFVASTQLAMELWERQVLDAASTWLADFASAEDRAGFEHRSREDIPWMDSFYLWDTSDGSLIHPPPPPPPPSADELACVLGVERAAPVLHAPAEALAYISCLPAPPRVEVLITTRAATLLSEAELPVAALRAMHAGQLSDDTTLELGITRGIPAPDLAHWRLLRIDLLMTLGQLDAAQDQALGLATEIVELPGSALGAILAEVTPTLTTQLAELAPPPSWSELLVKLERCERRVDAWREVRDRLSERSELPEAGQRPHLLRDPFGRPPYLLLFRRAATPGLAVAVQVDESVLAERLLGVVEEGSGATVMVQDGAGRRIAGPPTADWRERQLTFPLVFEYLRVNIPRGGGPSDAGRGRLLLIQLLPIGLTVLMGTLALLARSAAIRRRLELETSRSEFVTRVTHELKTPLAGIRVMAEVLELGAYRDAEEHTELAQRILKESERLAKRVDEVLNMSRAPADFRFEPTDLGALCHEVAERWRDLLDQSEIELELDIRPMPTIQAQQALLRDALGALLENAIKYRDPTRPSKVRVEARVSGRRWIVIEVSDNGIGVPPAKRRTIFEPFARVEGPGRGMSGGHGLGLSFVANAARVHRGRAECREGLEGGARFILRIRR